MKDRKKQYNPPPFVKVPVPQVEPTIKVIHTVKESLPMEAFSAMRELSLEQKRDMLKIYEQKTFMLHHDLAQAVAMRDALHYEVHELNAPRWVRHASVANLHGGGARLLPCAKCGKPTEWSFDGRPQCTFKNETPTAPEHAICYVEAGFKRNVTRPERDVANILSTYAGEGIKSKKGKK
jgi:hypothetical protein